MKHLRKPQASGSKAACARGPAAPLDEGIVKERKSHGFYAKMTDGELVDYARKLIGEMGIRNRRGLRRADGGLYQVLLKKGLLGKVEFAEGQRKWGSDEEVFDYVRKFIEEQGIRNRSGLKKADSGLYEVLWKRGLLDLAFASIDKAKEEAHFAQLREAVALYLGDGE